MTGIIELTIYKVRFLIYLQDHGRLMEINVFPFPARLRIYLFYKKFARDILIRKSA